MPFTFSHPAIVIPLSKTRLRLSLTGLVAGSIVPDFEYYLQLKLDENTGHHWHGFFIFDFPAAVILCYIFHHFVRKVFIDFLPEWYRLRLYSATDFNWHAYAAAHKTNVAVSICIGILSHLLWDGFTHHDGMFVLLLPVLSKSIPVFHINIPVYGLLQFFSSVWGLWMIQRFIAKMPVETGRIEPVQNNYAYWAWMTALGVVIFVARIFLMPAYSTFWDIFFAAIGSMLYGWLFISIIYTKLVKTQSAKL